VGFLQCLRGEAAPHLRHQWGSSLLRAHPRQRGGGLPLTEELLADLAYRSQELEEELIELGIMLLDSETSARRPGVRQQIEICFSSLKRIFGLGETLATTLVGLVTRILRRR
jgi:hypothetical protein